MPSAEFSVLFADANCGAEIFSDPALRAYVCFLSKLYHEWGQIAMENIKKSRKKRRFDTAA